MNGSFNQLFSADIILAAETLQEIFEQLESAKRGKRNIDVLSS